MRDGRSQKTLKNKVFSGYGCHGDGPLAQPKEVVMARVALCEVRGLLVDTIEKLSGEDGTEWAEELKQALRKGVASLLRKVREVAVGGIQKFVANDAFGENNSDGIKFCLWPDFSNNFLGKIEEDVKPAAIAIHRLEKALRDDRIMAELGIDIKTKKGVIKLAHFREMLKFQAQGQEGPLLVNGYANIAYIEDENGTVWVVYAYWYSVDRGWYVNVDSVGDPSEWTAGFQVLSQVS